MKKLIVKRSKNLKPAFLSLLGILVAVAIICVLAFTTFKFYLTKPVLDKPTEKYIQEQNIDTTNYQSLLSSTKDKLKNAVQTENEHANELEETQ
ncbi:MAG: hypothetical protein WC412_05610 [Candidatus Omnitrophota bacterium]|jgi:capsular polysaccharide biosynthesis protein